MPRANRHDSWTYENWPEPHRAAWKCAIEPGDGYRRPGPASLWAARTRWNNERAFGRYQQFLIKTERSDQGLLPEIENLRAFGLHLAETLSRSSVIAIFTQMTGALRAMYPKADLHYLNAIVNRLRKDATSVRAVDGRLISPTQLIEIGTSIMSPCPKRRRWEKETFRAGALIVACTHFPLRLRNWQMMVIGQHLDLDTGRVRFAAHEMKGKKPFEASLPAEALGPLRKFVAVYRPRLLAKGAVDQGYLFPSRSGGPTHRNALGRSVKSAIKRVAGVDFNMHLFRHAAATFVAERRPELTRIVTGLLHHSRLKTANQHYIRGAKRRSFKLFQRAVRDIIARNHRCRVRSANRANLADSRKARKQRRSGQ